MSDLGIKIYSDGADSKEIIKMDEDNLVDGFTTNPTLMKKAGVRDYLGFAKEVLALKRSLFHLRYFLMIWMKCIDKH